MNKPTESLTESLNHQIDVESGLIEKTYEEKVRYVYDLGNISLMTPETILSELIEAPEYAYVPKMPAIVIGLCNVRGNLIPVFDLYKHLDIGRKTDKSYLLALGSGENTVGIMLEGLPYVLKESEYAPIQRVPDLPVNLQSHVLQAFKKQDKVLVEYNHDNFFRSLCH